MMTKEEIRSSLIEATKKMNAIIGSQVPVTAPFFDLRKEIPSLFSGINACLDFDPDDYSFRLLIDKDNYINASYNADYDGYRACICLTYKEEIYWGGDIYFPVHAIKSYIPLFDNMVQLIAKQVKVFRGYDKAEKTEELFASVVESYATSTIKLKGLHIIANNPQSVTVSKRIVKNIFLSTKVSLNDFETRLNLFDKTFKQLKSLDLNLKDIKYKAINYWDKKSGIGIEYVATGAGENHDYKISVDDLLSSDTDICKKN